MKRLIVVLLALPCLALGYPLTPDGHSPGTRCRDSDPDFLEYRYEEEIPYCERNVAAALKTRIYDDYDIPRAERKHYTIDHIIPLSLGGSNHRRNLWPEHKRVKALRPTLEVELYQELRDGEIDQDEAIETILWAKFHPNGRRQK